MKKFFFTILFGLMAMTMQAQRCAVLDFQIGNGITSEDVEGISYTFRSNFHPADYTMLERAQINRAIKNLGYVPTDMTFQQILKVGRNLEASYLVVGNISKFMDVYYVDIRVINVSTGSTLVTESADFERAAYRTNMEYLAKHLAGKLVSAAQ
jgi:hypothetical protein